MIHKTDPIIEDDIVYPGGYVVSSEDCWRPGAYDSEEAAQFAQRFDDETLLGLQDRLDIGGLISLQMLKAI